MTYNARSREIMGQIEESVRSVFDSHDEGVLTVRFFSMSRELTKSASFSIDEYSDDASMVCDKIPFDLIMELRREMYDESKGTWITATARLDCFNEDFSFIFNFDTRPNIFNDDFIYTDSDSMVLPDREEILADFRRYSRGDNFIPDWVSELSLEQEMVDSAVDAADPYDLFSEALDVRPSLEVDYEELVECDVWQKVWSKLGKSYVDHLVRDKSLIPVFVEQAKSYQQAPAIFDGLEVNLAKDFINKLAEDLTIIERAVFVNNLYVSRGDDLQFDVEGDDEIDTDTLDDELSEIIVELIMSQTRQRFPDLETDALM